MSHKRKKETDIEDFSKSNEIHKIARQRIKTDNNVFSLDLKSLLICKLIGINRNYALKPLLKYKKRLNSNKLHEIKDKLESLKFSKSYCIIFLVCPFIKPAL